MALDRSKIAQQAERLVVSGKIEAAIQQYELLVRDNPRDVNTINKIGDLYSRLGKRREAIQQYTKIGDFYARDGFFLKAIAIFKKISKLDPTHLDTLSRLADMYARQGLVLEARSQYQQVLGQAISAGDRPRTIATYHALVRLDPDNLAHRVALADALSADGKKAEAAEEFERIGAELERTGRPDEAREAYRKALALKPASMAIRARLAANHVASGDLEGGLKLVEEGLGTAPQDPSLLSVLADIRQRRGEHTQANKAIESAVAGPGASPDVLLQGTRHFLERNDLPRAWDAATVAIDGLLKSGSPHAALDLLDEILARQEDHHAALARLAEIALATGQPARASRSAARLLDLCIDLGCGEGTAHAGLLLRLFPADASIREKAELLRGAQLDGAGRMRLEETRSEDSGAPGDAGAMEAGERAAGAASAAEDMRIEDEDFIAEHMTEADVFIKYGLTDRAVEQLQSVTARFPGHFPALIRLKEIFLEDGNRESARAQMVTIVRACVAAGDRDAAEAALGELRRFDPAGPDLSELSALLDPAMATEPPRSVAAAPGQEEEELEVELLADAPEEDELAEGAGVEAPTAAELKSIDALLGRGEREAAVNALRGLAERFGSHPELVSRMKMAVAMAPAAAVPETSEPEEFAIELEEEMANVETAAATMGSAGDAAAPLDFRQDAAGIFSGEVAPSMGADDFLDDLASEIDAALSGHPDTSSDQVAGGEAAPEGHSLEEIVAAFKKGVEQQVSAEDFDTHYSLGIAYKEMGLIDEAIGEFQFAAKAPRLLVDCCSMLGVCFQEKGLTALAVRWYRRGIEASSGRDEETVLGLRYDLAELLLRAGEKAEALNLFTEVYGSNSKYRDVSSRLRELRT